MTVKKLVAAMVPAMLLAGAAAHAYSFEDVIIEQWVGSGSKSAVVVVDFQVKSYAFGVKWDGDLTGRQALTAIDEATSLDANVGNWGLTDSISYDGHTLAYDSYDWNPEANWWEYWISTDGETWTSYWDNCSKRTLTDGAWDGWGWSPPYPAVGNPPAVPTVPEPSSILALLSMIGLTGSARLLGSRRK